MDRQTTGFLADAGSQKARKFCPQHLAPLSMLRSRPVYPSLATRRTHAFDPRDGLFGVPQLTPRLLSGPPFGFALRTFVAVARRRHYGAKIAHRHSAALPSSFPSPQRISRERSASHRRPMLKGGNGSAIDKTMRSRGPFARAWPMRRDSSTHGHRPKLFRSPFRHRTLQLPRRRRHPRNKQ